MIINNNSDFLFAFEANMSNPNGDPDQENKPRMDYETKTALVSDARRKRDCRNFFKAKGMPIFVDTLREQKVTMEKMLEHYRNQWLTDDQKMMALFDENAELKELWEKLSKKSKKTTYLDVYQDKDFQKDKKEFGLFNNLFITQLIQKELIDIRLFGSAMAVDNVSRTFTGPVQITWGYSMHPVDLVKSNTISSIMNEDNSTFGKKHKLHYGLFMHSGTINKLSARLTGMTEQDRELFRASLVQGMLMNQTDSKQGQTPLFYLEIQYTPSFDGFLGDLRRFLKVGCNEQQPIRSFSDLSLDDSELVEAVQYMKQAGYIDRVVGWFHPVLKVSNILRVDIDQMVDLWAPVELAGIDR
ncbi:type I CRISPR-associated protein Cas7 [Brevibacillus humidisoli]|uniref:CRISPR-associated protein n=1 Tax=Brevibacillus humidisoli TaxID=2895522 RepID=UPI001E4052EF|nr:CRISPR-associated protein [Brevibacillus humidisoli]UFJ39859.1 type I CRISPR-associated protein Cas7 [Brevibacillus humidisoli]